MPRPPKRGCRGDLAAANRAASADDKPDAGAAQRSGLDTLDQVFQGTAAPGDQNAKPELFAVASRRVHGNPVRGTAVRLSYHAPIPSSRLPQPVGIPQAHGTIRR